MSGSYIYPPDFATLARDAWLGALRENEWLVSLLPSDGDLREFLDVAYHASFMREETRGIAFRVGYFTDEYLVRFRAPRMPNSPALTSLIAPRPFSTAELVRLAPAVDPTKSMFVVQQVAGAGLQVTAILDFGRNWWAMRRGEAAEDGAYTPPNVFTITSFEPGNLVISREGTDVLILRRGRLSQPVPDILECGPVASFFAPVHQQFYDAVCRQVHSSNFTGDADDQYPIRYYNQFLLSILLRVQEAAHGGTLLLIRDEIEHEDSRLTDRVSIKYRCHVDRAWQLLGHECVAFRNYHAHHSAVWDSPSVTQQDFHADVRNANERRWLRDAHDDLLAFIAQLTAVDGAVVLTDRLRLFGFGAEIVAQSQTLTSVTVSHNSTLQNTTVTPVDSYGTRHRSAFRFCSSLEDSVAFVISQDGGVKAIKRVGAAVVVWPDVDVTS